VAANSRAKPKRKDGERDQRYKKPTITQKKKNSRYKNIHAPKGTHWCTEHKAYEPIELFSSNSSATNGLSDRCKEGRKAYRKRYEEQYGSQNEKTKTIRIPIRLHQAYKEACKTRDVSMQRTARVALEFYLKYACTYPYCTKPGANAYRRCADHVLAVNPAQE